ncbi:hypothetical protein N7504_007005 [Penicillium tannophilum]|nr:hypothetical protein N7504_007005 [Penicillium tannophilum]
MPYPSFKAMFAAGCVLSLTTQGLALPGSRSSIHSGASSSSSVRHGAVGSSTTSSSASASSTVSTATTTGGAVTVSGTTTTISDASLTATSTDESVVTVEETGVAYLTDCTIYKTGDSSDDDDSSFTDLNAAVGIETYGTLYLYSSTITTDGGSANGLHMYEDGSSAYLHDVTVSASGDGSHGIYTAGGYIYGENLVITTEDQRGSAIATDNGGDLTGTASVAPACVIDGANSFTLVDPVITSGTEEYGVFQIVSTGSGNTDVAYAYVTGGSVAETYGTYGVCGIFANVAANSEFGTPGSGGTLTLELTDVDISGVVTIDDISTAYLILTDSTWSDAINTDDTASNATVYLDSDSTWTLTADSYVTVITDDDTTVANIISAGFSIYYDSSYNTWLDGETIYLSGGGYLTPA